MLTPPSNGTISYDAVTNTATYSCNTGSTLTGAPQITCNDTTMQWSATPPTCEGASTLMHVTIASYVHAICKYSGFVAKSL